jgi:dTDP-4-amino-4,6-dideoxygalactose transaminase
LKILCANPSKQFLSYQDDIEAAVVRVLRGSQYVLGEEVSSLESEFAEFIGTEHAIGVANGTDALELALRALNVGPGDEVITVSHTAVATVAAIHAVGAVPVLADIKLNTYTIDSDQLKTLVSPKTKALIAVHRYTWLRMPLKHMARTGRVKKLGHLESLTALVVTQLRI